jgi:para-nitrobenzyl esterase
VCSLTPTLPPNPAEAVASGQFARVPIVIGANRDEGRTFAQGFIGATQQAYEQWVRTAFGDRASAVLARYPWPADADRFTAAYLIGAIMTDSGYIVGIGGSANRRLTQDFARWTRTWAYEFAHGTGPGLTPIPGYVWGAGGAPGTPRSLPTCSPPSTTAFRSPPPSTRRNGSWPER